LALPKKAAVTLVSVFVRFISRLSVADCRGFQVGVNGVSLKVLIVGIEFHWN